MPVQNNQLLQALPLLLLLIYYVFEVSDLFLSKTQLWVELMVEHVFVLFTDVLDLLGEVFEHLFYLVEHCEHFLFCSLHQGSVLGRYIEQGQIVIAKGICLAYRLEGLALFKTHPNTLGGLLRHHGHGVSD